MIRRICNSSVGRSALSDVNEWMDVRYVGTESVPFIPLGNLKDVLGSSVIGWGHPME